jgi:lipoprotein NlpI
MLIPAAADEAATRPRLADIREALSEGRADEAIGMADQLVSAAPEDPRLLLLRAQVYSAIGKHERAVEDCDRAITIRPDLPSAYDQRGDAHFKLGRFEASARDFDRYVELVPGSEPGHWKRGISYYYVGQYENGRRQFEGYQTVDDSDVENAVWRFLCIARADGIHAARKSMLKIRHDPRVPMMKVYDLYRGEATPAEVLAEAQRADLTAEQRNAGLFYAHLYLGLYYEVTGNAELARTHLVIAADKYRISHYMWDVARVHADLLRKQLPADTGVEPDDR